MSDEKKTGEANAGFAAVPGAWRQIEDLADYDPEVVTKAVRQLAERRPSAPARGLSLETFLAYEAGQEDARAEGLTPAQAAVLRAARELRLAERETEAAAAALGQATANSYTELWEREHAAIRDESAKRAAHRAAVDELLKAEGVKEVAR